MIETERHYGKLTPEEQADLDRLLLKMKELNKDKLGNRKIPRKEIAPLPDKEYIRLFEYLRHCCHLVSCWTQKTRAIRMVADKRGMSFNEVQDEVVDSMAIHCYIYSWRHYEHSEEPTAYVLSTAKFGWSSWIEEQNMYHVGADKALADWVEEERREGHKVNTAWDGH